MSDTDDKGSINSIIEIFSGTLWEAELIKSFLEDERISSFLKNNTLNTYAYDPIISEGVKVMISNSDSRRAAEIVERYFKNLNR